jgi:4'-phosphopantetheinyl transferase
VRGSAVAAPQQSPARITGVAGVPEYGGRPMERKSAVETYVGGQDGPHAGVELQGIAGPGFEVIVQPLDVGTAAVRASAALLSEDERRRAERLAFDRDRNRFIEARASLRRLLGARLHVRPESVEFAYGPHGKPELARPLSIPPLHFNHSRYQDLALFALSSEHVVGIDLEGVRPIRDADDIVSAFFSPREQSHYFSLHASDRVEAFFNCWTRKEAVLKARGDGMSVPLDFFDVTLAPHEPAMLLRLDGDEGDASDWSLASWSPAPGCVAAIATRRLVS